MKYFIPLFLILSFAGQAQQKNVQSRIVDSLVPVIVEAFSHQVKWKEAAAAIGLINSDGLNFYAPNSLVPSFNNITGVRMEERSPGSYRLSIRGSTLRSPFAVRNTKVYWNDLPLSDATGNTYLNLIEIGQINAVEIIKGPSSSIYGAGTGGVVLLKPGLAFTDTLQNKIDADVEYGSFNLFKEQLSWKKQSKNFSSELFESYAKSDGFREQSALKKINLLYQASYQHKQHQLDLLTWYTDLYYQTPGGITLAQMNANPKLARQPTASLPGAVQQQTAIYNKTAFAGIKDQWRIASNQQLLSYVSINHTQFENPFITNYEFRNETNAAIGSKLIVNARSNKLQWISGFEWLYNHSIITDYGNKKGKPDTLQFNDQVYANQWFVYTQLEKVFFTNWHFSAGISLNQQQFNYNRVSDPFAKAQTKSTKIVPAPRISLLYDLSHSISVYSILAYGFSPPSLAELRPSDGNYYGELAPEKGWNWELGFKGFLVDRRIQFDLAYYHFQLKDAIVRRNNTAGAEYFINAGSAVQEGIEASLKAMIIKPNTGFISKANIGCSYSYQPYRFIEYQQGAISYSGNELTGVPKNSAVLGLDLLFFQKLAMHSSINSVSGIPLTDANDVYASPYQLLQIKMDYPLRFKNIAAQIYLGVDKALNQTYSLGNDINAAGKRYYNPASERNVFAGIHFQLNK